MERVGPTPEELGRVGVDMSTWHDMGEAGRHSPSRREAVPGTLA